MSDSRKRKAGVEQKVVIWQKIAVLPIAVKEGKDELTPGQYLHVKDLVKQLVGFGARQFDSALWIEPFEDFWELKDKGGTLGKKNVRVYFAFVSNLNEVVVLSTEKKEEDGAAKPSVRYRLRNRLRMYLKGDFEGEVIYYERPQD